MAEHMLTEGCLGLGGVQVADTLRRRRAVDAQQDEGRPVRLAQQARGLIELALLADVAGHGEAASGGNLGKVQGLDVVVDAAAELRDLDDVQFVFIGDGTEIGVLQERVKQRELTNVRFIERKPPEEIHKYFALAQVLFAHLEKKQVFKMQIPSKIIAYMACGRPVLCAIEGEAAKMVEQAGAGITCASQDAHALAESVRYLYSLPGQELEALGQKGRETFLGSYTRSLQVERIEGFLMEALGKK